MVPIRRSQRMMVRLLAGLALIFSVCQPMRACACKLDAQDAGHVGHGCCAESAGAQDAKACCGTCCHSPGSAKDSACQCSPPAAGDDGDRCGCRCSTPNSDRPAVPTTTDRHNTANVGVVLFVDLYSAADSYRSMQAVSSVPPWVATGNMRQSLLQVWRK